MSLLSQPGITARDLITVQPLSSQLIDPNNDYRGYGWLPFGPPLRVYSKKLGAGEGFRDGKTQTDVNYTLYADYRRGTTFPITEKHQIWHPEFSRRLDNGDPDYSDRLLDVQSVLVYPNEGIAELQVGGSY